MQLSCAERNDFTGRTLRSAFGKNSNNMASERSLILVSIVAIALLDLFFDEDLELAVYVAEEIFLRLEPGLRVSSNCENGGSPFLRFRKCLTLAGGRLAGNELE